MPLITYACECSAVKKFFRAAKDAPPFFTCEKCGKEMKKTMRAPASCSKITIDNGLQSKAVEILPDILELMEERSSKDYRKE